MVAQACEHCKNQWIVHPKWLKCKPCELSLNFPLNTASKVVSLSCPPHGQVNKLHLREQPNLWVNLLCLTLSPSCLVSGVWLISASVSACIPRTWNCTFPSVRELGFEFLALLKILSSALLECPLIKNAASWASYRVWHLSTFCLSGPAHPGLCQISTAF